MESSALYSLLFIYGIIGTWIVELISLEMTKQGMKNICFFGKCSLFKQPFVAFPCENIHEGAH